MVRSAAAGVIAVASLGLTGSIGPEEPPLPLDVMTFNIRTSIGRDGDNVWPNRREIVARTIRRSQPHVVGLQEALTDQIEYLDEALPQYRWLGVDRRLNGGTGLSESTPIFYRYEELSPIESGNFWLTDTPDQPPRGRRGSRIVTWARFHHIESGREVYAFNTHLTLRRGRRQHESIELITKRISALPEESAVVVTGDFNAVAETSETWRIATNDRLQDAWVAAAARTGPPTTFGGFGPPRSGAAANRIDWILIGGQIDVLSAETVLDNEAGRYPSDHYPVVARLQLYP